MKLSIVVSLAVIGLLLQSCFVSGQKLVFESVQDALDQLPELSAFNRECLASTALMEQLQSPGLTQFAPVDVGLKPLLAHDDLASVLGDAYSVEDLFSAAVVPGAALTLEDLQDGMRLTTLHEHRVVVSVKSSSAGVVFTVNRARVITGNIRAGSSVLHLVAPIVAPPAYQDVVDALMGFQGPVAAWQALPALGDAGSTSTAPGPGGLEPSLVATAPSARAATEAGAVATSGPTMHAVGGSAQAGSYFAVTAAGADDTELQDDPVVHSYESGLVHADGAESGSVGGSGGATTATPSGWMDLLVPAQAADTASAPGTGAKSGAGQCVIAAWQQMLLVLVALALLLAFC